MIDDAFKFGSLMPLYSITDTTTNTQALDSQSPFTFYDFLKYTKEQLSPIQYNEAYLQYLNNWNVVKQLIEPAAQQTIVERYTELLKDISLNYLTLEERRFITNIDFNDPSDLDIVIPFYSKKITEICNFYNSKRESLKYKVLKNSNKGNITSVEQSIAEAVTDYLLTDDVNMAVLNRSSESIHNALTALSIEVEELYDIYSRYLDIDPVKTADDYSVKTNLRRELFSANVNDIEADIFINFDNAVKKQIFNTVNVFLASLGTNFTINYTFSAVNLDCKKGDKLYDLVTSNIGRATREVQLKERLIKKFIGADFYYIKTGNTLTDTTSGILFKADNPSGNLLNRHFPSTASVEEESELVSARRLGLFFAPDKQSILYFSAPVKRYVINSSKLQANKLYIFPDPNRYGNTSTLTDSADLNSPLIHIEDYTSTINNQSLYSVEGDINTSPYDQSFYSYFSRNQTAPLEIGYDLTSISNLGILTQYATDIYGNQYGLFKNVRRKQIISAPITENYDYYQDTFDSEQVVVDVSWLNNICVPDYYAYTVYDNGPIVTIGTEYEATNNSTLTGDFFDEKYAPGILYVRDILSTTINSISIALSPIVSKYKQSIQLELANNLRDFNIYNDIIYFKTKKFLVIDRIGYSNKIIYAGTNNTYIELADTTISNVSVPFFFEDHDYCMVVTISIVDSHSNDSFIVPTIYKIDYKTLTKELVYAPNNSLNLFANPLPINYTRVGRVNLVYNSRNNIYAIVTTLEDQNGIPYLYQIIFTYTNSVIQVRSTNINLIQFNIDTYHNTANWYDTDYTYLLYNSLTGTSFVTDIQGGYIEIYE